MGWDDDLAGYIRDDCGIDYGVQINEKVLSAVPTVESVNGELMCCTTVQISESLNEAEINALYDYLSGQYADGLGREFEQEEIEVEDGVLYVHLWNRDQFDFEIIKHPAAEQEKIAEQADLQKQSPKMNGNKKYEITDIAHPQYPWLHRIRALRDVGYLIKEGDIGGFVQSEDNLSQQGDCWIKDDAICCEDALVAQDARASGHAVIRGSALVSGSARVCNAGIVEDYAIVTGGQILRNARISGNARIGSNQVTNLTPTISQKAVVYGEVYGKVEVTGCTVILPGTKIDMPTQDQLKIEDGKALVLQPPDRISHGPIKRPQKPKHTTPER